MCRSLYFYILLCYLIICENNVVHCVCNGNSYILCDSLVDLGSLMKNTLYHEIIIGNQCQTPQHTLKDDTLTQISAIELKIINQLNASNEFIVLPTLLTTGIMLYGNDLRTLNIIYNSWISVKLKILSLHNNNIENINLAYKTSNFLFDGLFHISIGTIDLSYNKLKDIKSLDNKNVNLSANTLILSHNELSSIRPNSLPTELVSLELDHNKFVYFSRMNLNSQNLSRLEYLSVAHNKLQFVDNVPVMESLMYLDLSFNNIYHMPELFHYFNNLVTLELEWNNLISFTFPKRGKITTDGIRINLSYNRLRNLDLTSVKNYTAEIILHGNPWNCKCIDNLQTDLIKSCRSRQTDYCFPDHVPYCVINNFYGEPCSGEQIEESTFNFFRNITRRVMTWPRHRCEWKFVYGKKCDANS